MKRAWVWVFASIAWLSAPAAWAQDFCADLRVMLDAAPTEFADITGARLSEEPELHLLVFEGTFGLTGAGSCAVAQQTVDGRRFSTSYTCSHTGSDDAEGLQALRSATQDCLDVVWEQQAGDLGPLVAQYGLIRLSITHNGERGGLALGVEVFRDDRGEVMGSPTRGNRIETNGEQRCSPRSPREIQEFLTIYGERVGAERFESSQFVGYRNAISRPVVAFATRPSHPAHPAIIVRDVIEENGSRSLVASGDFAGDCEAFHALLNEVVEMNRNIGR
ncbi:MAG: hypothetical protein NW206_06440 [Hyphomonadaceae bacterium]|nr:hypothetical protein [Hyphomonadaceae bacterium]